jgi:hypothetical protein
MTYGGNKRLFEIGEIMRNTPITIVRRNGSLSSTVDLSRVLVGKSNRDTDQLWRSCVNDELKRRLGFAVFVKFHNPVDLGNH